MHVQGWNNQKVWVEVVNGYRLPCPEGCPALVYTWMRQCWQVISSHQAINIHPSAPVFHNSTQHHIQCMLVLLLLSQVNPHDRPLFSDLRDMFEFINKRLEENPDLSILNTFQMERVVYNDAGQKEDIAVVPETGASYYAPQDGKAPLAQYYLAQKADAPAIAPMPAYNLKPVATLRRQQSGELLYDECEEECSSTEMYNSKDKTDDDAADRPTGLSPSLPLAAQRRLTDWGDHQEQGKRASVALSQSSQADIIAEMVSRQRHAMSVRVPHRQTRLNPPSSIPESSADGVSDPEARPTLRSPPLLVLMTSQSIDVNTESDIPPP